MAVAPIDLIAINPKICHGQPYVAGTRIRVQDIVMFQRNGWDVEQIAANFDVLRKAQIYAALAYYHDHAAEIDEQIEIASSIKQDDQGFNIAEIKQRMNK